VQNQSGYMAYPEVLCIKQLNSAEQIF